MYKLVLRPNEILSPEMLISEESDDNEPRYKKYKLVKIRKQQV